MSSQQENYNGVVLSTKETQATSEKILEGEDEHFSVTTSSPTIPIFGTNTDMTTIPENNLSDSLPPGDSEKFKYDRTLSSTSSTSDRKNPPISPEALDTAIRRRSIIKDPGMKSTMKKKNVSFSRLPSEACVKNSADCVKAMQEGHQFVKMRSNSRVYNRVYWLEGKDNCLRWEPSKKDAGKAKIDISNIREVRPGKSTEMFLSSDISTHFPDECSFSIIYGEGKTLDLIANSADDSNVWVTGLRCLMTGQDIEGLKLRTDARDMWLSSMFDGADINKDGFLDEDESIELLTTLSDGIRELSIKQKLQEHFQLNATVGARLKKEEFVEIFKDVATRPEIYFLLVKYASRGDQLSTDDLTLFLESEQGVQQATLKQCIEIINNHEPSETIRNIPAIGIDGFTKYLMSDECSIFNPAHSQVCQDMNQPLSHYFIASSHNTYIMEDQVGGPSSASAYVRALLRCCRCVELDCWDGPEGIPHVTHGHTMTNRIPFVQVIEAISESAFRNSVYPVILCLENHCSIEQQIKMAQILKEILGDKIYVEESNEVETLPSPEVLKRKFIIRSRKLPAECDEEQGYVSGEDEGKEVENQPPMYNNEEIVRVNINDQQQIALSKQLSDLVSLSAKKKLREQFSMNEQKNSCTQTCSIHELEATSFVENIPEQFVSHNKKFLSRVFPSGARIDSSNFNPQDFWNCGVQIAALNYQTPDCSVTSYSCKLSYQKLSDPHIQSLSESLGLMMDINDGRFSMNGGCGYVLKPLVMRDELAFYNTQPSDSIPGVSPKLLHLRIISGQNFPKPRGGGAKGQVIDPYVLIELFGVPGDCAELRTRTAPNNSGGSPIFDESFDFGLSLPSLALVRFVVLDDEFIGDEFIGQYTIPFECLQPGYRHLRLRSIFDEPLEDATLFVHITVSEPDFIVNFSGNTVVPSSANIPAKLSKRNSGQKKLRKTRSRKDLEVINIRDVMVAKADELFRTALDDIRLAASLRDSHRSSLASFKEACGVTPQSSVKQCVCALWKRARNETGGIENAPTHQKKTRKLSTPVMDSDPSNADNVRQRAQSADTATARLRRQHSEASQSSNDASVTPQLPRVSLVRRDRRLALELRGQCATNDTWRKTALMLETLSSESLSVLDQAKAVCERLSECHDNARKLYVELPSLLTASSTANMETNDVQVVNGGNGTTKKKTTRKKSISAADVERRRRQNADENFRWNCGIIKGYCASLKSCQADSEKVLIDIWTSALACGMVSNAGSTESHMSPNGCEHPENLNGNNNTHPAVKVNGTRLSTFKRSVSHVTWSKAPRSISHDAYPVTLL